jgi:hypothetical protein
MKRSYFLAGLALVMSAGCSQQSGVPAAEEPVARAAPGQSPSFGVPYQQPTAQDIEQARLDWLRAEKPNSRTNETTQGGGAAGGS